VVEPEHRRVASTYNCDNRLVRCATVQRACRVEKLMQLMINKS
jgi:hypothetical protein